MEQIGEKAEEGRIYPKEKSWILTPFFKFHFLLVLLLFRIGSLLLPPLSLERNQILFLPHIRTKWHLCSYLENIEVMEEGASFERKHYIRHGLFFGFRMGGIRQFQKSRKLAS